MNILKTDGGWWNVKVFVHIFQQSKWINLFDLNSCCLRIDFMFKMHSTKIPPIILNANHCNWIVNLFICELNNRYSPKYYLRLLLKKSEKSSKGGPLYIIIKITITLWNSAWICDLRLIVADSDKLLAMHLNIYKNTYIYCSIQRCIFHICG